ncbi:DUF1800 domain-containing protein [Asticcacaulis sp. 201]|uniref:DUF1800 domain-containing protein n=1 Tax=Asticcacaulis sp. 201 TaxID=3028787 RepID=UPI0029163D03|nr:DUF1800 domain-containing protein [Asticcacaulis sp. 201]MDV6329537.1 DUF1800 domain-containing protein [Asticcacaulis sp. 201]
MATGPAAARHTASASDIAVANRIGFGVTPSEIADINEIGLNTWLSEQLHPASDDAGLPPDIAAIIDAMPHLKKSGDDQVAEIASLRKKADDATKAFNAAQQTSAVASTSNTPAPAGGMTLTTVAAPAASPPPSGNQVFNTYRGETLTEIQARRVLREIYGRDQLREQMAWFWFNHFNVLWDKGDTSYRIADYEDRALRPHALGKFRDLLEADLRHPAMLQYLDNVQNASGHINENYAREIMELHSMGVGSGYSQADVEALAHILTGVGYAPVSQTIEVSQAQQALLIRDGDFVFNPAKHDFSDKVFLGHTIKGSGYDEVKQALDLICQNPATARFISTKLARLFVADDPPPSLINAMADRFRSSNGDISEILSVMFHSTEFRQSLKTPLLKDPEHYVISAMRIAYDGRTIMNAKPVVNWISQLGEPVYAHVTPDGYPMTRTFWNGPGQIEQRFEIARNIGYGYNSLFKPDGVTAPIETTMPQLQSVVSQAGIDQTLTPPTRTALAQANSTGEWNTLFLASPDFMGR